MAAYSNTSLCTSLVTYTHDNIAPTATSFVRTSGQNAFTNSVPVNFTLTFSEPINASTFTAGDISNSGTATGVNWTVTDSGDHTVFTIAATSSGNGTLIPRLGVASISDPASNDNGSPHEASQSVSYTAALFTVTVNQAVGQSDPVKTLPISYTVVFSSAVGSSSFDITDVTNAGTATSVTWTLSTTDDITWTLSATAASSDGTIIPAIASNRAQDAFGNQNGAATSTDKSVTYDSTAPTFSGPYTVSPANPSASLTPTIRGVASETSTVTLYYDSACSSPKSAATANTTFASPG